MPYGAYYDDPNFLYGATNRYYDDAPSDYDPDRLLWRFEVAWRGDFVFFAEANGETEAVFAVGCDWSRGRPKWITYDGSGLARFDPGRLVITLIDDNDRYNPYNTGSPLYGYVEPGKFCRLLVRRNQDTVYVHRFSGIVIDVVSYQDEDSLEKFADISAADGWSVLQENPVYLPAISNTNPNSSLLNVLDAVDWPGLWGSSMESGPILLPYFWAGAKPARDVLHDVADTLGSRIYIRGDGKFYYVSRLSAVPAVAVSLTQSDLLRSIPVNAPWDHVFNRVDVRAKSVSPYSDIGAAWGDSIIFNPLPALDSRQIPEFSIASGESFELNGMYGLPSNLLFESDAKILFLFGGYGIPTFPLTKFLYHFGTATGGAGSDITDYVLPEMFQDGGTAFRGKLKNTYPGTVYSRRIAVVDKAYAYIERGVAVYSKAPVTPPRIIKKFTVDTPYLINSSPLSGHLSSLVNWYYGLVTSQWVLPTVMIEARPDIQFRDVGELIGLNLPARMINSNFRIGLVKERWLSKNGQAVRTTIQTEPSYAG